MWPWVHHQARTLASRHGCCPASPTLNSGIAALQSRKRKTAMDQKPQFELSSSRPVTWRNRYRINGRNPPDWGSSRLPFKLTWLDAHAPTSQKPGGRPIRPQVERRIHGSGELVQPPVGSAPAEQLNERPVQGSGNTPGGSASQRAPRSCRSSRPSPPRAARDAYSGDTG